MTSATREKTLHRLFLISVCIKGGAGLLQTLAGGPFFFVATEAIERFVVFLTAPELSEDPNDWIGTTLTRAVQHFSADTALFAGAYLVIHGLIKLFLVADLLRGKLWAYNVAEELPVNRGAPSAELAFGARYNPTKLFRVDSELKYDVQLLPREQIRPILRRCDPPRVV